MEGFLLLVTTRVCLLYNLFYHCGDIADVCIITRDAALLVKSQEESDGHRGLVKAARASRRRAWTCVYTSTSPKTTNTQLVLDNWSPSNSHSDRMRFRSHHMGSHSRTGRSLRSHQRHSSRRSCHHMGNHSRSESSP